MVQYNKDNIVEELKAFDRLDLADDIFKIAELLINKKITKKIRSKVKNILSQLYSKPYEQGISIPLEFFDTTIGEILISAYYKLEVYITLSDMCEMTGLSRTWLWQLVKDGKIKGGNKFDKVYIFPSSSLDDLNK